MIPIDFSEMIEIPCAKEAFEVVDMKSANWCVTKIGEAKKRMEDREALVVDYKESMDKWLASENEKDMDTVTRMEEFVRPWAEIEIMKGKAKSIKLPCGNVGTREGSERIIIDDEDAAILWAEAFKPEAVRVKKEINKRELAKTDCPHYHTETSPASFYVKPDAGLFKLEGK